MRKLLKSFALILLAVAQTSAFAQLDFVKRIQDGMDSKLMNEKQTNRKDGFNFDQKGSASSAQAPASAASSQTSAESKK